MKERTLKLAMGILLLAGMFLLARKGAEVTFSSHEDADRTKAVIVIDPGHGGSDPGKIGVHQEKEKDINLQISYFLKEELENKGVEVVMTRKTDRDLSKEGAKNKKASDLQNRCKIIEQTAPDCVLSVHQNSYHQPDIKGAQTFYYTGSQEGKKLAEMIQLSMKEQLDRENHRMAKENDSYYMLKKTKVPVVIVECGFLSNPGEAVLLSEKEYQRKIAKAVSSAVTEYLGL